LAWPTILSLILLALNDGWFKHSDAPGWFTGKLSDFAGSFALPVVLVSLIELARRDFSSAVLVRVVSIAVGALFAAMKLVPAVRSVVGRAWGTLLLRPAHPVRVAADPWDLVALVSCVVVPWFVSSRSESLVRVG